MSIQYDFLYKNTTIPGDVWFINNVNKACIPVVKCVLTSHRKYNGYDVLLPCKCKTINPAAADAGVWASCQLRKIAGAHAPGMPGTFSPSPQVNDPDMHHGTCGTHVPWCMPGSLTSDFLWNRRRGNTFPAFPAHAQPAILRIWKEAHVMRFVKYFCACCCRYHVVAVVNYFEERFSPFQTWMLQ